MAYNYYPYSNPYIQQPYQAPVQYQAPFQQQQQQQIQNGGFISVRNESEARGYPVAPGNSITFKDETAPYVYTKTMGFSQLDQPIFEKYKLVKEEDPNNVRAVVADEAIDNAVQKKLEEQIDQLWKEVNSLKESRQQQQQRQSQRRSVKNE